MTTTPSSTNSSFTPPPYVPSKIILSASQVNFLFNEFCSNLKCLSHTPTLVFDQLIFKSNDFFTAILEREHLDHATIRERERAEHTAAIEREYLKHVAVLEKERLQHATALEQERLQHITVLERERLEHAIALEKCQNENKASQPPNDQLRTELMELKEAVTILKANSPQISSVVASSPIIGTFRTTEVRELTQPSPKTSRVISFSKEYSAPPNVVVGLNMLDIGCGSNVRVTSYASNIQKDAFSVNIDSWSDTTLRGGGCTWLEAKENDQDFQFGTFSTKEVRPESNPRTVTSRHITFSRAYSAAPQVVVWLTGFNMSREKVWRVKTYAKNITETGFTIHIDTWLDSVLYSASASWASYPADKPNIFSGRFSTLDVRSWNSGQLYTRGYANFAANIFTTTPRTFIALNSIDISQKHKLRIVTRASSVSAAGMTWHIDSWDDTILYSAGASYIALG